MKNHFRDAGLVLAVISLTVSSVAMLIFTYSASLTAFCIFAPVLFLTAGFTAAKLITVTRRNFQYFAHIDEEIGQMERVSLSGLPLSIAIVDKTGKLVWYNDEFARSFEEEAVYGSPIETITKLGIGKLLEKESCEIGYKGGYYQVYASSPNESETQEVFMIYFKNITRLRLLEIEKKMTQPVVIVFIIDSYDELFGGSAESETANITVQIDKLLEDFISGACGILRKYGKERFWAVVEEKYVRAMIDEKVKILDRVREIQVNDRVNVTLSIGIGRTAKTIAESEEFAKQALDMALGRGGDQAAIKTENGFEFFGGVSKGIERHTKVKTRIIANSLIEAIEASDEIYIMGHRNSDLDSVGSSVGLACAIRRLGKSAHALIDPNTTLSLQLYNYITEKEEKPGLFLNLAQAREGFGDRSLLIVADTHNPKIVDDPELLERAKKIVVIDHHRKMVNFIDNAMIFHHEPYASSASEMVTELLQYFGDAGKIPSVYADALLAGITLDTKNFTLRTGVRTFEAAAFLRKLGADTVSVKNLFSNSIECYKQKSELVSSASVYRNCAVAITEKVTDDMRIAAPQAADELLGVSDVNASFVISKTSGGEISVSCRSLGAVNVQLIAEELGGGGHQTMAGAQFKDSSTGQVYQKLKEAIDHYYESLNS